MRSYYLNLEKLTIDNFKEWLETTDLIPSWKILLEYIDFLQTIKKLGITNLMQLKETLKTKAKLQEFSVKSDLSEDYLSVLRRVVFGFHPKPNRIADFPELSGEIVEKLEKDGIKNTFQLFNQLNTDQQLNEFSRKTDIDKSHCLMLKAFADLSRIKWVNHTFAFMLIEGGYDSSKKVADADSMELYHTIKEVNEKYKFYRGTIGIKDMNRCIEFAQMLTYDWS